VFTCHKIFLQVGVLVHDEVSAPLSPVHVMVAVPS
jgi:hypothetical protein